jgi:hypothetical protein
LRDNEKNHTRIGSFDVANCGRSALSSYSLLSGFFTYFNT